MQKKKSCCWFKYGYAFRRAQGLPSSFQNSRSIAFRSPPDSIVVLLASLSSPLRLFKFSTQLGPDLSITLADAVDSPSFQDLKEKRRSRGRRKKKKWRVFLHIAPGPSSIGNDCDAPTYSAAVPPAAKRKVTLFPLPRKRREAPEIGKERKKKTLRSSAQGPNQAAGETNKATHQLLQSLIADSIDPPSPANKSIEDNNNTKKKGANSSQ